MLLKLERKSEVLVVEAVVEGICEKVVLLSRNLNSIPDGRGLWYDTGQRHGLP